MNKIVRLRTCNIIIGNVVRKNIDISLYDRYRAIVSNENQSSWRAVGIGNHRTHDDRRWISYYTFISITATIPHPLRKDRSVMLHNCTIDFMRKKINKALIIAFQYTETMLTVLLVIYLMNLDFKEFLNISKSNFQARTQVVEIISSIYLECIISIWLRIYHTVLPISNIIFIINMIWKQK